ncbi:hypothetical protein KJ969_04620 [Patescibacteria group bacterium]|nr:hypothetical protein [Patescibacteria group bacterium]MBU1922520.1 hypothetical protein [Patescibacteria group bacterium]
MKERNGTNHAPRDIVVMEIPLGKIKLEDAGTVSVKLQFTERGNVYLRVPAGKSADGRPLSFRFSMRGVDGLFAEEGEYQPESKWDPCEVSFRPGRTYGRKGTVVLFHGRGYLDREQRPARDGRPDIKFVIPDDDVDKMLERIGKIITGKATYEDFVALSLGEKDEAEEKSEAKDEPRVATEDKAKTEPIKAESRPEPPKPEAKPKKAKAKPKTKPEAKAADKDNDNKSEIAAPPPVAN